MRPPYAAMATAQPRFNTRFGGFSAVTCYGLRGATETFRVSVFAYKIVVLVSFDFWYGFFKILKYKLLAHRLINVSSILYRPTIGPI